MALDRHDLKLLSQFDDKGWTFTKGNGSQERRAYDMMCSGHLERRNAVYRMTQKVVEYRWAYRRTALGRKAMRDTMTSPSGASARKIIGRERSEA